MARKKVEAEVTAKKDQTATSKKKRVFKTTPTLREQTVKGQEKSVTTKRTRIRKFFGHKIFSPFRAIGRFIKRIWNSKILTPVRFIVRWIGKIVWPTYFRNSWKELQLVVWPDFKTTWKLTFAVILFGAVFGLFIAGLDIVLEKLFREVLLG